MKFLHTADWQIGMKAAHVGAAGERIRRARLETARKVAEVARNQHVDFVILAGDTFEDNTVAGHLIQQVADVLSSCNCPVYVIPGNHDPLEPGSVWEHPAWPDARNVTVLTEARPVEAPGGTIYPCPVFQKYSEADPTAWIDANSEPCISIGIAHGNVERTQTGNTELPIPADAAQLRGLDYLALGHWHSTQIFPSQEGPIAAYSGTHETTKFGEPDSGNVLIVEIPGRGSSPLVEKIHTGTLSWEQLEWQINHPDDLRALVDHVRRWPSPEHSLISIQLRGVLLPEAGEMLERLEELLRARFVFGSCDTSSLIPSPGGEEWIDTLPPGYIRDAARKLHAHAISTEDPQAADVARAALLELYTIAQETSQ